MVFFFFSSRRRHTRCSRDWSSDVCSSDLLLLILVIPFAAFSRPNGIIFLVPVAVLALWLWKQNRRDRKSTRLNSSHGYISYAVFCLKKKKILELVLSILVMSPAVVPSVVVL